MRQVIADSEGFFRIFVFVLTDDTRGGGEQPVKFADANRWASSGCTALTTNVLSSPVGPDHRFYALEYVFAGRMGVEPKEIESFGPPLNAQLQLSGLDLCDRTCASRCTRRGTG